MDKSLLDILEEERDYILEIEELRRRIAKADEKNSHLYELWIHGDDTLIPLIERSDVELSAIKEMLVEYEQQLNGIRDEIKKKIYSLTDTTVESQLDRFMNRYVKRGCITRKGRLSYIKINRTRD